MFWIIWQLRTKRWNFVKLKVRWGGRRRPSTTAGKAAVACNQVQPTALFHHLFIHTEPLSLCEICAVQSMHVWFSIAASAVPVGNRDSYVSRSRSSRAARHSVCGMMHHPTSQQHLSKEQLDCPLRLQKRKESDSPFPQCLRLPANLWWKPF